MRARHVFEGRDVTILHVANDGSAVVPILIQYDDATLASGRWWTQAELLEPLDEEAAAALAEHVLRRLR